MHALSNQVLERIGSTLAERITDEPLPSPIIDRATQLDLVQSHVLGALSTALANPTDYLLLEADGELFLLERRSAGVERGSAR
jgi:hypothetical protein